MKIEEFLKIYENISSIPAVTNFEGPLYNIISDFSFDGYKKTLDKNYIAFIPENYNGNKLISIHIDRLGIVFDRGFTYSNYYGYELINKKYKPSLTFGKRFINEKIVAYNIQGEKIGEGEVIDCSIKENEKLVFEIDGLNSKRLNSPTPVSYRNNITVKNGQLEGQLDNAISIALAYFLLIDKIQCPILFTTQEEIGSSWKHVYDFMEIQELNTLITLDTTSIEGLSDFNSTDIVFRTSDDLADFDLSLIEKFIDISKKQNLRYYLKTKNPEQSKIKTITEVGHIIKESKNKFNGASIQFPTIKYHTNHETVKIKSINLVYSVIKDYFASVEY